MPCDRLLCPRAFLKEEPDYQSAPEELQMLLDTPPQFHGEKYGIHLALLTAIHNFCSHVWRSEGASMTWYLFRQSCVRADRVSAHLERSANRRIVAGKKEILARRIGRNEIAAIYICGALAQSQVQYFSQKHGGVKQYAQTFISNAGQQNGLYWVSAPGTSCSPIGPLVAYASDEGITIKPNHAQPYCGYYFRRLDSQGPDAKGGAKPYVVNGKMTGGFAYVAYPSKSGDTGIMTFMINQDRVVFEKDLGKDTANVAETMAGVNPDNSWTALQ
jgi:hypothetical protein